MPGRSGTVPREQCRFVDRKEELRALEAAGEEGGLIVVYGRRRAGKTRLVREWLMRAELRYVFYTAHLTTSTTSA